MDHTAKYITSCCIYGSYSQYITSWCIYGSYSHVHYLLLYLWIIQLSTLPLAVFMDHTASTLPLAVFMDHTAKYITSCCIYRSYSQVHYLLLYLWIIQPSTLPLAVFIDHTAKYITSCCIYGSYIRMVASSHALVGGHR